MSLSQQKLNTSIEYLKGVGPARAQILKKELGIYTFADLLYYFPFRYVDKTKFYTVNQITSETTYIQLKGRITHLEELGEKYKKRLLATFEDDTGQIQLIWFKGIRWIKNNLKSNVNYIIFGKPNYYRGSVNIPHPDYEIEDTNNIHHRGKFEAVYSSSDHLRRVGLNSKGFNKLFSNLFETIKAPDIIDNIPETIRQRFQLIKRFDALQYIHLPKEQVQIKQAQRRLKFEELFILQIKILSVKIDRQNTIKGMAMPKIDTLFTNFYKQQLPFELTNAQKRVLKEIRNDILSGSQMNRLLQGDVGSGKTIVSLMSMLMAVENHFQAALMAPTEILAQQHYSTLIKMLSGTKVSVEILTGSIKGKRRNAILEKLASGEIDILAGTHALLEKGVKFDKLGMIIIDEQHRFGVAQRARLIAHGQAPHILVMTATPIPRTLAMTVYGDLDVSIIDELPPGREAIKTVHFKEYERDKMLHIVHKALESKQQVFVIYPLIYESAKLDYKALEEGFESIRNIFPEPKYTVDMLHGKMKTAEKEAAMNRFSKGKTHILVSTTVVEVGVDVPNASVMVIESAERFGLSQLHQLRGRVGRGNAASYCILMTGSKLSYEANERMRIMSESNDGFLIAETDLNLRGPGEIEGTLQSGHIILSIANLKTDKAILNVARQTAMDLLKSDPQLKKHENLGLKQFMQFKFKESKRWGRIA